MTDLDRLRTGATHQPANEAGRRRPERDLIATAGEARDAAYAFAEVLGERRRRERGDQAANPEGGAEARIPQPQEGGGRVALSPVTRRRSRPRTHSEPEEGERLAPPSRGT